MPKTAKTPTVDAEVAASPATAAASAEKAAPEAPAKSVKSVKAAKPAKPVKAPKAVKAAATVPLRTRAKAKPAAAPAAPAAAPLAAEKAAPKPKAQPKEKLVRDSFTMPQADFALIAQLKARALGFQRPAKKSELLRAGLQALAALNDEVLQAVLAQLTQIKTGRPRKSE